MAKNWWETDNVLGEQKPSFAKPEVSPSAAGNWWKEHSEVGVKPAKPREKSHVENLPFGIGQAATKGLDAGNKLRKDNKEFFETHDALERSAFGLPMSLVAQAATGPKLLLSMLGQGLFGAGEGIRDKITEKGLDLDSSDAASIAVRGGVSTLGPVVGRAFSPALPNASLVPGTALEKGAATRAASKQGISDEVLELLAKSGKDKLSVLSKSHPGVINKTQVPEWLKTAATKVTDGAMPAIFGGIFGHQMGGLTGAALGTLGGLGAANAKDIVTKGLPKYVNNTAMHSPVAQAILSALARKSGEGVADAIKYD